MSLSHQQVRLLSHTTPVSSLVEKRKKWEGRKLQVQPEEGFMGAGGPPPLRVAMDWLPSCAQLPRVAYTFTNSSGQGLVS